MDPRYNKLIDLLLSDKDGNSFLHTLYSRFSGSNRKQRDEDTFLSYLSDKLSAFAGTCLRESIDEVDAKLKDEETCRNRLSRLEPGRLEELWKKLSEIIFAKSTDTTQLRLSVDILVKDPFFAPVTTDQGPITNPNVQEAVTIAAWNREFVGSASIELWKHIKERYNARQLETQYGNFCPIIQSSGMGKSRAVDQLGTEHFVINICLRAIGTTGFPPPDDGAEYYFKATQDQKLMEKRMDAFFVALFEETLQHVTTLSAHFSREENRYVGLAKLFRLRMTEGQTMGKTSPFRSSFYIKVFAKATVLVDEGKALSPSSSFKSLQDFLTLTIMDPQDDVLAPRVILAFDEAAVLAEGPHPALSTFRRKLSEMNSCSLFTLFLSTTGHISEFLSPAGLPDPSLRILKKTENLNPAFTTCAFDSFARGAEDGELTIRTVSEELYMTHLGRPLWARPLDNIDEKGRLELRQGAVAFAVAKLLNMTDYSWNASHNFNPTRVIAVLAQRLPIEFHTTMNLNFQTSLVENHMRVCLSLDPRSERMVTVSASEPILSEAAFVVMQHPNYKVLDGLKQLLTGFSVHKGDRGEFIALLLAILARDAVIRLINAPRMWQTPGLRNGGDTLLEWKRVFSVPEFIKHLFKGLDPEFVGEIEKEFGDTKMHFNHFIKGNQQALARPHYLVRMLARGAALLCANNQPGVDAIIPYVRGDKLCEESTVGILLQFKNDAKYKKNLDGKAMEKMNPFGPMLFRGEHAPSHVIRLFFAMASEESGLETRSVTVKDGTHSCKAYDIWCAGLDSQYLLPIRSDLENDWNIALDASHGWDDMYRVPGKKELQNQLFHLNPATALDKKFWENFFPVTKEA